MSSVTNTKHHRDNSSNCKQYITWVGTRPKPYNSSTLRSGNVELLFFHVVLPYCAYSKSGGVAAVYTSNYV